MVRSPGQSTVTLLKAVPAVLAGDLGIATGAAGDVLQLPYRDALALVQGGYARFGSPARDVGNSDDEGTRDQLIGGALGAGATVNSTGIEAHGASSARVLVTSTAAASVAIEQSIDGQAWLRPVAATAIAAGAAVLVEQDIAGRFVRAALIGGASAGTASGQLTLV